MAAKQRVSQWRPSRDFLNGGQAESSDFQEQRVAGGSFEKNKKGGRLQSLIRCSTGNLICSVFYVWHGGGLYKLGRRKAGYKGKKQRVLSGPAQSCNSLGMVANDAVGQGLQLLSLDRDGISSG